MLRYREGPQIGIRRAVLYHPLIAELTAMRRTLQSRTKHLQFCALMRTAHQ